jgi:hypothetical protein
VAVHNQPMDAFRSPDYDIDLRVAVPEIVS